MLATNSLLARLAASGAFLASRRPAVCSLTRRRRVANHATDKATKSDTTLYLEHGKPLVFGKDSAKGIRLHGLTPEVVDTKTVKADDLLIHDERAAEPSLAFLLSRMRYPEFPEPLGVFRAVEQDRYADLVRRQNEQAIAKLGRGDLQKLVTGDETWEVV